MSFLFDNRRKQYSVDRLRCLYADLLHHIDVSNEDLGRRGIDGEDEALRNKFMRFSLRRKIIPTNDNNDELENLNDSHKNSFNRKPEKREIAAAFRILAATRSPDKEGGNFGAAAVRDDASVSALSVARSIEARVVELISSIGEVVVNGEQTQNKTHLRSDSVFEYFCEKNILSLLVEIAKETRSFNNARSGSCFHGVVWSPLVKAQVFRTISLWIKNVKNHACLYYLLSHNSVNELIISLFPLKKWTDPAMEKMMPAYVDLLKNLALQLDSDPNIFPFLLLQNPVLSGSSLSFPLFSAALETATSSYAQSNSHAYGTGLNVIVNIMQISFPSIQTWVGNANVEQGRIADHLCRRLHDRFLRIANLTTGPVVDSVRSNAIAGQLAGLRVQMGMINEVFWSGIRGLNVRLCESLLRRVVSVMLNNLLPIHRTRFLVVGVHDADVIPHREALAQLSAVFLSLLFSNLVYPPFQRMLAVSLLHPRSSPIWRSFGEYPSDQDSSETYVIMPALNDLVEGNTANETCPNPYREELIKSLRGDYGEWRIIASANLLESVLTSEAMDGSTLSSLAVISSLESDGSYSATSIEEALATFLERSHTLPSPVLVTALECVGSVALQMIYRVVMNATNDGKDCAKFHSVLQGSPVWRGLIRAHQFFCTRALESETSKGVSDIFLDLAETAISNRYTAHFHKSGLATYTCSLSLRGGSTGIGFSSEVLIRKFRGVSSNDVETSRFNLQMALQFRSLCKVVERLGHALENTRIVDHAPNAAKKKVELDLMDVADEISRTIGGLANKPTNGMDLDLRGRMTFRFSLASNGQETQAPPPSTGENPKPTGRRIRALPELLVLDHTDFFVVKPIVAQIESNRGTVITTISLRSVIATAADGEWLHVAVRHEDVGFLIKNGKKANVFYLSVTDSIVSLQ
jgi:hypothetical protein